MSQKYDVIVIGAGHAGCEASLAAARMGCNTAVVTVSCETIGLMPCNPAIGGPAKGQIVGEIDALGGEMGKAADATMIQMKVLNRSRGPAVQCLRSQNDKYLYKDYMRNVIESQDNLTAIEGMAVDLISDGHTVTGVVMDNGATYTARAVVITTGTFLNACMHTGPKQTVGGRIGEKSAVGLSDALRKLGLKLSRFKTGTTPRLHADSLDYSKMKTQPGDPEFLRFSAETPYSDRYKTQTYCYLTTTTEDTHKVILANLERSPMYTKAITSTGPRYCPSIEDKIVRFSDKPSHQIFIEPESLSTKEIYAQGLNTSLPDDVQKAFLKTMPGLENVEILKFGYAVEYDYVIATQLQPTLETRDIYGLFCAGQLNGTSGYEEAAGQGLVAGINAACRVLGRDPMVLTRENSYIGTLIDDLITKEIFEPYRMLTSRSEYRLLLRQDNTDFRLGEIGYSLGLISETRHQRTLANRAQIDALKKTWSKTNISDELVCTLELERKIRLQDALKRPDVTLDSVFGGLESFDDFDTFDNYRRAIVEIKYAGYIDRQTLEIERVKQFENRLIPEHVDYEAIKGLRNESRVRFAQYRPKTIYDAKRIGGINPADITVLLTYLRHGSLTT